MKQVVMYKCQTCGYESPKWLGRCPECETWNSFVEEVKSDRHRRNLIQSESKLYTLKSAPSEEEKIIKTNIDEFDRLLGGGIVHNSVTLIGGPPGIGKSTLLLQIANALSEKYKILYVSGEESIPQIKLRANRLKINSENIHLLSESNLFRIIDSINSIKPDILVIDSIQTIYDPEIPSSQGTVTQIRECAQQILYLSKTMSFSTFILGHITKSGEIAGPKILEHMVDTVLYFEPETDQPHRILRVEKNRFGPTNEVGIFKMEPEGLKPVPNPSLYFISSDRATNTSGSAIISIMEGTRPILLEVQTLMCQTEYSLPRRIFTGLDFNRGVILISVIEKRMKLPLNKFDIFINVVGGIKLKEPSADLGICISLLSAYFDRVIDRDILFIGEIGLGGEIRGVHYPLERVITAERIGIKSVFMPKINQKAIKFYQGKINIIGVDTIHESWENEIIMKKI